MFNLFLASFLSLRKVSKYSKPKESMMRTDEHLYDELKRLKKDLARVTQERDLLKKAAAYFAKESQ